MERQPVKPATVAILAGVAGLTVAYLVTRGARSAVDTAGAIITTAGQAIDPTSTENVFYQGTNAVGAILTQQPRESFSLGAWAWEKLNPEQAARDRAITGA